ncbi:MAG TPA: hypothetical protein ENJ28_03320 [Gammaproteobacteria bacterium]|nr:hypothetical protein [Gammaproteobacteria bacterium]
MRTYLIAIFFLLLAGCAANLKFIDRQTGDSYVGKTGSTVGNSGSVTAQIGDEQYTGEWVYSQMGGGYTIGSVSTTSVGSEGYASGYGTVSGITASSSGNGLITMHGDKGGYVRCVFNFNSFSNTGIGECQRNDGKLFDVTIKR